MGLTVMMAIAPDGSTIPDTLELRRWDVRRRLPIPVVNEFEGVAYDFTVINGLAAVYTGDSYKCGLCGFALGYWIAFLGGEQSAKSRRYTDPPMHVECARAATHLCPHIARKNAARATEVRVGKASGEEQVVTPPGMVLERPAKWVLYITRKFSMTFARQGDDLLYFFDAAAPKELHYYGYNEDDVLQLEKVVKR
jgi:hypothetical protein